MKRRLEHAKLMHLPLLEAVCGGGERLGHRCDGDPGVAGEPGEVLDLGGRVLCVEHPDPDRVAGDLLLGGGGVLGGDLGPLAVAFMKLGGVIRRSPSAGAWSAKMLSDAPTGVPA